MRDLGGEERAESRRDTLLDPRARAMLRLLDACGWPAMSRRTPRQARHDLRVLHAALGSWRPVRNVGDALIDGPGGTIPVRIYRPGGRGDTRRPVVVYFHGGGFVVGDLFTADGVCRRLANASGATVVSVHYRRAPEHELPAAHVDAVAAARWVQAHAGQVGGDARRVVVAGDSAGAGLAAHVVQRLRDEGRPAALQLLFNPGLDFSLEHTDRDPAVAKLLDWDTIEWFASHAVPPPIDRADPVISPSRARDLSGLPSAIVITAGVDPFRSDGERYVHALEEAGVAVSWHDFPGQLHGFTDLDLVFPAARESLRRAAAAVRNVEPVDLPVDLAPFEGIRWKQPDRGRLLRLREGAQRFPLVNGADAVRCLVEARLQATASQLKNAICTSEGATP